VFILKINPKEEEEKESEIEKGEWGVWEKKRKKTES